MSFIKLSRIRKNLAYFEAPVCESVDVAISLLRPRHIAALNALISYSNRFLVVFPSQTTLAERTNRSRQTMNDAIGDLESLGLVSSNYIHMSSCEYKIAEQFNDVSIRSKWSAILTSLRALPVALLLANSGMPSRTTLNLRATQLNNIKYITYEKDSLSSSNIPFIYESSSSERYWSRVDVAARMLANRIIGERLQQVAVHTTRRKMELLSEILPKALINSADKTNPIRNSIRQLEWLKLSRWGQIELMQFPDEAIRYATSGSKMATPRDPFKYFISLCYEYCRTNGARIDVATTTNLVHKYRRPEDFAMTLPKTITSAQFAKGFESKYKPNTPACRKEVVFEPRDRSKKPIKFLSLSREEQESFIEGLPSYFAPLFFKGILTSKDTIKGQRVALIKLIDDLGVPFEGILDQQQLDQIIADDILMPDEAV